MRHGRGCGEIGRHARLKILSLSSGAGSIPATRTILIGFLGFVALGCYEVLDVGRGV